MNKEKHSKVPTAEQPTYTTRLTRFTVDSFCGETSRNYTFLEKNYIEKKIFIDQHTVFKSRATLLQLYKFNIKVRYGTSTKRKYVNTGKLTLNSLNRNTYIYKVNLLY